jgi:hypothetical protein
LCRWLAFFLDDAALAFAFGADRVGGRALPKTLGPELIDDLLSRLNFSSNQRRHIRRLYKSRADSNNYTIKLDFPGVGQMASVSLPPDGGEMIRPISIECRHRTRH